MTIILYCLKVRILMVFDEAQKRNLDYFLNKIVTFIVSPINRNFDEKQSIEYFVGKVTKFDNMGVWHEHPKTKNLSFIFYNHLVSIAEEQVISTKPTEDAPTTMKDLLDLIEKAKT